MKNKGKRSIQLMIGLVIGVLGLLVVCVSIFAFQTFLDANKPTRERRVQQVRLIKTMPPPRIKERLPEPIVKNEESIKKEIDEIPPPEQIQDQVEDNLPVNDMLGLDTVGIDGADAFGLAAKKGGRSIIIGDPRNEAPMKKYAWYNRIVESVLKKEIDNQIAKTGKSPEGKQRVLIKIVLDDLGNIKDYIIYHSSGNEMLDQAVRTALDNMHLIQELPPKEMPKTLKLQISLAG